MAKDKSLLTHLHKITRTRQVRFQSGDSHYTVTERTDMGGPVTKVEHFSPEGEWPVPTPEVTTPTQRKKRMSGNGVDPNEGNPYLTACLIGVGVFLCIILVLIVVLAQNGG